MPLFWKLCRWCSSGVNMPSLSLNVNMCKLQHRMQKWTLLKELCVLFTTGDTVWPPSSLGRRHQENVVSSHGHNRPKNEAGPPTPNLIQSPMRQKNAAWARWTWPERYERRRRHRRHNLLYPPSRGGSLISNDSVRSFKTSIPTCSPSTFTEACCTRITTWLSSTNHMVFLSEVRSVYVICRLTYN